MGLISSDIDITKPITGEPTTQSVRTNFASAKSEIEKLQETKVFRVTSVNESAELFQQCAVDNVGQVVTFTTVQQDFSSGVFSYDFVNQEIVIEQACAYSWTLNAQVVRKVNTLDLDWSIWIQTLLPGGAWTNFPGSRKTITLDATAANQKHVIGFGNTNVVTVPGTRVRFMQACTNVSKQVGIIGYPPSGGYPSTAACTLNIFRNGFVSE